MSLTTLLRGITAALAGYLTIAAGNLLFLELLLGGIGYDESSPRDLGIAAAGAIISGLAGGVVAGRIGAMQPLRHALYVWIPLILDTVWVVTAVDRRGSLWLDLGASAIILGSTLLGGYLVQRRGTPPPSEKEPSRP